MDSSDLSRTDALPQDLQSLLLAYSAALAQEPGVPYKIPECCVALYVGPSPDPERLLVFTTNPAILIPPAQDWLTEVCRERKQKNAPRSANAETPDEDALRTARANRIGRTVPHSDRRGCTARSSQGRRRFLRRGLRP